ncbi:hypothetical protein RN001_000944 [Aquatica leii]|uniref:Thyroglobulin type-1 domain-containing protein n=1 Tax=Aquatica leii TaxID=1421715 RepID=A0AAN7QMB5_9COLE|nr:hypothetical protein RN001_000944 [Aquatica leii]
MKKILALISCVIFLIKNSKSENVCNEEFCKAYLAKESCAELPEACKSPNSTHNGIFLPAPGPCNCCKYCLQNTGKGEPCAMGDPSSLTPTTICGHGLACKITNDVPTCQIMDTPCINAQLSFDENVETGSIGHLETKPSCDRNGLYGSYHCVPGEICYCVAENGERIFGEVPFTPNPIFALKCKCSRSYHKGKQINNRNLNPNEYFRCQSNGDYDTIQCVEDKCLCVDADNGHLTYPDLEPVNVTTIAESSLPCFNNNTHLEAEYFRICEEKYLDMLNKTEEYKKNGFELFGHIMPNCQLDGYFGPVQETFNTKYCSDILGNLLENFEVPKTSALSPTMNCNCARVRTILMDPEKPECCENGNYKQIQRRRGLCRCVDKNGNQIGKEVNCQQIGQLKCLTNACTI